jgi:uncharacterized repeat protein (TIGR03943 family)
MTSLFTRWIPSLTLAVWSSVLLGTYYTGRVSAFLHPSFRPGVVVAGFVLGTLALFIASRPTPPDCCADATCTHPLARSKGGRWMTFLILVLPVAVAAWLSPEQFSKQAFEQRGIATDASGLGERKAIKSPAPAPATSAVKEGEPAANTAPVAPASKEPGVAPTQIEQTAKTATAPASAPASAPANAPASAAQEGSEPLPEYLQRTVEGYVIVEVLDMLYAVQDSQLRKDFEGRTVQLIAQMMPSKSANGPDNRFKAVRMFMTCCAADARPVATLVEVSPLPEVPEMTWVRIVGKATFPIENGKRTSVIQATSVTQTKPPEETMLF